MKMPYSKKMLLADNIELETRLEQCYASNAELVIKMEQNKKAILDSNIEELITVNEELRNKHTRIRERLTEVMDRFNIIYNRETERYEQKPEENL